ncbi:hypothetical protein MPDQ_001993 [Monascus purpureus]|uniref:Uncharacterized protein n=1 Tax=Monascus purpureus TaxID=5098 RepID=A0A507R4C3_MONPU|nr:hypothetical protein MPDQ_001993 [Monascus purpureus]BDD56359.1 hypothetical protein MAP00_001824 [Monascus purpureus]
MPEPKKVLGRTTGSLNAPIAAFTMAILLCSYCISSIRSARREAANPHPAGQDDHPRSYRERSSVSLRSESWVQQALEESKEAEKRKKA